MRNDKACPHSSTVSYSITSVIALICTIISFIYCQEWKASLEQVILPNLEWRPLNALASAAIVMAYVIPLFIGAVLIHINLLFTRLIGLLLVGIAMGIVLRLVLVFASVLFPYG